MKKQQCLNLCFSFYCPCSPEEKIKILEKKVNELIEESCMAQSTGALQLVRRNVLFSRREAPHLSFVLIVDLIKNPLTDLDNMVGFKSLQLKRSILPPLLALCSDVSLQALEKAKEAGRKERTLVRHREKSGNGDHINLDLTYSVSSSI